MLTAVVRTPYKTRTPRYSRRVNWRAYPRQRPWRTRADSSRRHANRKRAPRQTAWTIATRPSRAADGFKGDAAAISASSTAERRRFTRGRAAAAASSIARSARIAWFRRIEAKRAPSRVAMTIRITPSVRFVTDASAAAASTKKSLASWPHRVIRASGMTAGASAPRRKEKPARDTPTTHASSAVLRIFALVQAFLCLSAWWCSGGFFSQRTAARAQATTTSCCSVNHLEVFWRHGQRLLALARTCVWRASILLR